MTRRSSERGNVFFALFGAVALIGVVGAATSTLMRGPLSTVVSVNNHAKADTQMQIASKLAMVRATQEVENGGDCDMDGTIEPIAPDVMAGLTGGGALPASIGAQQLDPWNTRYGYCVWDLGAEVNDSGCAASDPNNLRLAGGLNESYPVMVIISAGPDKSFQTECHAWDNPGATAPSNPDGLIVRPAGNDDIILGYTYSEAVQAAGGLWSLMSGDPDTITTDKNVAFSSGTVDFSSGTTASFQGTASFAANSRLDLGLGGLFLLPDEGQLQFCNTANNAALRINKSSGLNVIEMCDPGATATYADGWVPLGGAGATVAMIDDLSDAISYPGERILFMGDGAGLNYSSGNGVKNNIGIGINAASSLVTGDRNIVLGNHPLAAGTSGSIAIGHNLTGTLGSDQLQIGNFMTGNNIYSSSGSLGIGGALSVGTTVRANTYRFNDTSYGDSSITQILGAMHFATTSGSMTLTAPGNLGINTINPTERLTVSGNAYVSGRTSSDTYLVRDGGSPTDPGIRFGEDPLPASGFMGEMVTGSLQLGFVIDGSDRAWLANEGLGIGKKPTVALDVVGQGIFTDRVTSTGFQFASGQGLFPSGSGLSLNAGGSPHLYLSALGNVGIGAASPQVALEVDGAIRVGHETICNASRAGSIRYTSGDQLQVCSDSTNNWETIGTSGGGGGGSGSYWTRISTMDPRLYYAAGYVGVGVSDPLTTFHVNGNMLASGTYNAGDTPPAMGAGTRMLFSPRFSALRAGTVTDGRWDTLASYSTGLGYNVNPSGWGSVALGYSTTASGGYSTALGSGSTASGDVSFAAGSIVTASADKTVALGESAVAAGNNSFAFGLGAPTGARPTVSGQRSFGIFMGDQSGVTVGTDNLMALLGGRLLIDPNVPATDYVPSGSLTVDVQGNVGAMQYCDEDGANCFTAGDIAGGGVGIWEDASNVIRLTSGTVNYSSASLVFGSPQLANDGEDGHYNRFFYDKAKGAFRAGRAASNVWNDEYVGEFSTAFGEDTLASGTHSLAVGGPNTWAQGDYSVALGRWSSTGGNDSLAVGYRAGTAGEASISMGTKVDAEGDRSMAFGLGDTASGPAGFPKVTANDAFGIFMGDQGGVLLSSSNTMGLFGGRFVIDPAVPATRLYPAGTLALNIEGQVGATEYCDEEGNNCFDAADMGSAFGADGTIQFASAGKFASSPDFVFSSASGNVGIGTSTPLQKLHVDGKIRVSQALLLDAVTGAAPAFMNLSDLADTEIATPSGGEVLTYSSALGKWVNSPAGSLSVSAAGANREIQFNSNGAFSAANTFSYTAGGRLILNDPATQNNLFITGGVDSTSGQHNLAIGPNALITCTAAGCVRNLAVGYNALRANTTGFDNVAIGYVSGAANTTGNNNTSMGSWAFEKNTGGNYNAAFGMAAMNKNTTGSLNTALGAWAMPENLAGGGNVAVGFETLRSFTGGDNNVALGRGALYGGAGANGARNVAVGAMAGDSLTSGTDNILLGYDVDTPLPTTSNYLNIGNVIRGDMATATLEINGVGALTLPRGNDAARPSAAVNGMLRYNSTSNKFEGYQGGAWQDLLTGAASSSFVSLTDTPSSYAGSANQYVRVNAATNALEFTDQLVGTFSGVPAPDFIGLNDLSDVDLTVAPTGGDFLRYDSSSGSWKAGSMAGGTVSAAGTTGNIQFNNAGVLAADSNFSLSQSKLLLGMSATEDTVVAHSAGLTYSGVLNVIGLGSDTVGAIHAGVHGPSLGTSKDVYALIAQRRNSATWAAAGSVSAGQYLPGIAFAGQTTTGTQGANAGMQIGASIQGLVDGTVSAGVIPTSIVMHTSQTNHTGLTERLRITSAGDVILSGSGAIKVPSGADGQRPTVPVNGMLRYNSTSGKFEGYQGGAWQDLLTGAATGVTFLGLTDTPSSYASAANHYVRVNAATNALEFTDQVVGSVSGQPLPSFIGLDDLSDVDLSVAPTNGQVLSFDGSSGSWKAGSGGSSTAGGSSGQIQYNSSGSLAGSPAMTYANGEVSIDASSMAKSGVLRIFGAATNPAHPDAMLGLVSTKDDSEWNWTLNTGDPGRYADFVLAYKDSAGIWQEPMVVTGDNPSRVGFFVTQPGSSFDIGSTDAMIIPRGTTAQEPAAADGMLRYDTDTGKLRAVQGGVWTDVIGVGGGSIDDLSDGISNGTSTVFLGTGSGISSTGAYNTSLGISSLNANTTGEGNTALGYQTLLSNTTGSSNVAIGSTSLQANLTGVDNIAIGRSAMYFNTVGQSNVAIGPLSLYTNVAKSQNTAIGFGAMENANNTSTPEITYNTAVGYGALRGSATPANNTGTDNTAVGHEALGSNSSGSENVAMGNNALGQNTTGSYNTALGIYTLESNTVGTHNVAIGRNSLNRNTSGEENTAVGSDTLTYNTTGSYNTALGTSALSTNTGSRNTAVGQDSLYFNTVGGENTAVGMSALRLNTTGNYNAAFGHVALLNNTTGNKNTAIGEAALQGQSAAPLTGSGNTGVGTNSLFNVSGAAASNAGVGDNSLMYNTTGSSNTAVGSAAMQGVIATPLTGSQNTAVGKDALLAIRGAAANNVAIGAGAGNTTTTGSGNILIGQSAVAPTATTSSYLNIGNTITGDMATGNIAVNGTAALTVPRGTTAQAPTAANGMLRYDTTTNKLRAVQGGVWTDVIGAGGGSIDDLSDGKSNGTDTVFLGAGAGAGSPGTGNTAVGINALMSTTSAGISNMAFGSNALRNNTGGDYNVAIGSWALGDNTTGNGNTAVGEAALNANTTGGSNVALGSNALELNVTGNNNIAVGTSALNKNLSSENTAIGISAMLNMNSGTGNNSWNTAIGNYAMQGGASGTTGKSNVAIGHSALLDLTTGSNNVVMGRNAGENITTGSQNLILGPGAGSTLTTGSYNILLGYNIGSSSPNVIPNNTTYYMSIADAFFGDLDSTPRFGIGKYPDAELDVVGSIQYTGVITDVSDMRLKTDIHPLRNRGSMLDKLGQFDVYSFRMKDDVSQDIEFGVLAQEVQNVFPELVKTNVDTPEHYMSVNYVGLIAPLIAASQELKAENDNLKSQLNTLESKMASIEADMKGMKAHTGYGINKAGFGAGMAAGLTLLGGLGGVFWVNRRRKAA